LWLSLYRFVCLAGIQSPPLGLQQGIAHW
jgi:hypothetical protein